jgi:uncharacterized protein YjiS (DUF1127 family)
MPVHASLPTHGTRATAGLRLALKALAATALARLWRRHELARQRRALLALDDRMLKDIGVSRAEAEGEACRPFWRVGIGP